MPHRILNTLRRLRPAKRRQDRTIKTIALLEKRLPVTKRLSRSPKYGHWMPSVVAVFGACVPLVLALVLASLEGLIPWPHVDIPFPHMVSLPEPPEWLADVMYWLQKSWPIWIALGFLYLQRRRAAAS